MEQGTCVQTEGHGKNRAPPDEMGLRRLRKPRPRHDGRGDQCQGARCRSRRTGETLEPKPLHQRLLQLTDLDQRFVYVLRNHDVSNANLFACQYNAA